MKENNQHIIFDLLEKYDFLDLDPQNKQLVLDEMSPEEYASLRGSMSNLNNLAIHVPLPDIQIKNSLHKAIPRNEGKVVSVLKYPVPLYKVAATVVITFMLSFLIRSSINLPGSNQNNLPNIDTVYIKGDDTLKIGIKDSFNVFMKATTFVN